MGSLIGLSAGVEIFSEAGGEEVGDRVWSSVDRVVVVESTPPEAMVLVVDGTGELAECPYRSFSIYLQVRIHCPIEG